MLKVFCGSDTIAVRQKAFDCVHSFEKDGTAVTLIEGDGYVSGFLNDAIGASSLFGGQEVFLIDTPASNKDLNTEVSDLLEQLGSSNNLFVVIEGVILAPEKKQYATYAESLEEFKGKTLEKFNAFALADALSSRDKKSLWLLVQKAKLAGLSEEEMISILWWQIKSMRLAAVTKSAEEAGMKDFPYNKAKRSLSKFKEGELEKISHGLLTLYHQGHYGEADLDLGLEEWVLGL